MERAKDLTAIADKQQAFHRFFAIAAQRKIFRELVRACGL